MSTLAVSPLRVPKYVPIHIEDTSEHAFEQWVFQFQSLHMGLDRWTTFDIVGTNSTTFVPQDYGLTDGDQIWFRCLGYFEDNIMPNISQMDYDEDVTIFVTPSAAPMLSLSKNLLESPDDTLTVDLSYMQAFEEPPPDHFRIRVMLDSGLYGPAYQVGTAAKTFTGRELGLTKPLSAGMLQAWAHNAQENRYGDVSALSVSVDYPRPELPVVHVDERVYNTIRLWWERPANAEYITEYDLWWKPTNAAEWRHILLGNDATEVLIDVSEWGQGYSFVMMLAIHTPDGYAETDPFYTTIDRVEAFVFHNNMWKMCDAYVILQGEAEPVLQIWRQN